MIIYNTRSYQARSDVDPLMGCVYTLISRFLIGVLHNLYYVGTCKLTYAVK